MGGMNIYDFATMFLGVFLFMLPFWAGNNSSGENPQKTPDKDKEQIFRGSVPSDSEPQQAITPTNEPKPTCNITPCCHLVISCIDYGNYSKERHNNNNGSDHKDYTLKKSIICITIYTQKKDSVGNRE